MRIIIAALAAVTLAASPVQAQSRHGGHHGGGAYRGDSGLFWGGLGIVLGLSLADRYPYGTTYAPSYYGPSVYPSYVVAPPPAVVYSQVPAPAYSQAPSPVAATPDPIFYPRNGQSGAQTESDLQDCNRWATTQPKAMADGSVFLRATLACMDGRGYASR